MPDIFVDQPNNPEPTKNAKPGLDLKSAHSQLHVFASYYENPPKNVTFADLLEGEELLLFLRMHFVTNVPWIFKAIVLALIPIFFFIGASFGLFSINILPANYITLILLFYYLLVWGYIFVNYVTWFYNISLVTSKRIIDIDFSSVVFENVAATKLTQVEDVSYSQIGVVRSIFDYGDVLIQTAAAKVEFNFAAVPHPERVINIVNSLIGQDND